jgi:hypothetical protein
MCFRVVRLMRMGEKTRRCQLATFSRRLGSWKQGAPIAVAPLRPESRQGIVGAGHLEDYKSLVVAMA